MKKLAERKAGTITRTCEGKLNNIEITATLVQHANLPPCMYIRFSNGTVESYGTCTLEEFKRETNQEILESACRIQNRWLAAAIPAGCELPVHPDKKFRVKEVY